MPCCAAPAGISSRRSRAATSGTVLFFQPVPPTVPDWWQRKAPSTRFRWRSLGYSGRRTGGTALTFPLGARRRGRSSNTCTIIPPWMRWTSTRTTAANHRADSQADQPEPENRRHPVYYGAHVVCKTHQKAIRSNTVDAIPRDQWEIIENCHEAIVSKEQWERVQKLIDHRPPIMKGNACPFYNLFHGLLHCETCGKSMQARYEKVGRMDVNRTTKKKREPIDKSYYICQTYNRLGKNACTSHKIEARDLYNLVLADIQKHARKALRNSDAFYIQLTKKLEQKQDVDEVSLKKELNALTERSQEIDRLFMSLYEDKSKGILTEHRFVVMTEQLEQEQIQGKTRTQEIMEELSRVDDRSKDVRTFIEEIGQYAAVEELDEAIVHRLIDKIVIGQAHVENGEKVQRVTIVYNFVGEIQV